MRTGFGFDSHQLAEGKALILAGVRIDAPFGCLAHSDGDTAIHAIIDAMLGAAALGDIGSHFPPSEPAYAGIDSRELLRKTAGILHENEFVTANVDCTIVLERPKLAPHIAEMRRILAEDLQLHPSAVSVKAKTKEGGDAVGRGEAVEAYAVVTVEELNSEAWV